MAVILETSIGDITVDLYTDERPTCCRNFLKLCKMKYYNFSLFHSIQQNFIAQTGDPTGTGRGGESVFGKLFGEQAAFFEMELKPRIKHKKLGALSMVNNGNDMHGSQFFLTLGSELDYLDGLHTVFGEVSEGFDILTKLNETIVDEEKRPFKDVRILHTVVLDDPYDDPSGLAEYIPDKSPEPTKEILDSGRIGIAEKLDDYEGMAQEKVEELMKTKEAKANAQLLEMVGDLPEEDVAPPDTVLFVCKLNPVTSSEDLEIIFSRFGNILSCEVIKDQKSGESLQYAFVEFEKPEECENAYFKMDNVLIDERRIHVDFSQSVSKLKYQGREKDEKGRDRPKFAIKDTAWKRKDGYEYVFDESEPASSGKKKNKKKKKHRQRSTSSESEEEPRRPAKKQKPRSPSPDTQRFKRKQDSVRYQQKRDRSPVPEKRRNRSSSRDKDRRKQRDLSPSPRRDRSRSRERKQRQRRRDSSSSPERRVRSRSREKGQKQRRRDPSSSPERQHQKRGREKKQKYRNRDSSSSPERQQSRRRDRSPEYSDRRRERSRSRDRERRDKYR